jgi:hypothetical protein
MKPTTAKLLVPTVTLQPCVPGRPKQNNTTTTTISDPLLPLTMPPTAATVANQNAAMAARRNHRTTTTSPVQFTTTQPQHAPYFLGAPVTKLLCMIWVVGSLVVVRSGNVSSSKHGLQGSVPSGIMGNVVLLWHGWATRFFFHSTLELVVGLGFVAHYMRRLERELSSRRMIVWLFTVESVFWMLQVVALTTLDFDTASAYLFGEDSAKGPYVIVGALLYWYWMFIPRVYPRFVSLNMIDMNFSEKTFGYAWAVYVLRMSGAASLLMGALGMLGSAVFFFLLMLSSPSSDNSANRTPLFSMDVPDFIANWLPWDSLGNLLLLDSDPKVFAPLLLVHRDNNDNAGFGGLGAAGFAGMGGRPRQPRARRPAPPPPTAAAAAPPPSAEAVAQLTAMGFEEARVKEALQVSGNNVERAANILLSG